MTDNRNTPAPSIGARQRRGSTGGTTQLSNLLNKGGANNPIKQFSTVEYKNPIKDEAPTRFQAETYVIPAREVAEKVQLAPQNPRIWTTEEVQHLDLYEDIKATKKVNDHASCYRFEGEDVIYAADGGTRRAVVLALLEEGIEVPYPVKVIKLQKDQMWVTYNIVKSSDLNRHFSVVENARRFLDHAKANKLESQNQYRHAARMVHGLTINGVRFNALVFIDPVLDNLDDIEFFKNIPDMNMVTLKTLIPVCAFLTGNQQSDVNSLEYLHATPEERTAMHSIKAEKLAELNEAVNAKTHPTPKAMIKAVTAFCTVTKEESPKEKEKDKSAFVIEGEDALVCNLDDQGTNDIALGVFYLQENHTKQEMDVIAGVLREQEERVTAIKEALNEVHNAIQAALK